MPPPLDFQSFDQFAKYRDTIAADLCKDYSMPHSPEAFNLFWSRSERATGKKEDNPRLNKNDNYELVPFDERDEASERAALRGDVELFLTFEDVGWAPLTQEFGTDFAGCPVPPATTNFVGNVFEITSPLVIARKREACIQEKLGNAPAGRFEPDSDVAKEVIQARGGALPGALKCVEMCGDALTGDASAFPFDASTDVNKRVCNNLVEALSGTSAQGQPIDDIGALNNPLIFGGGLVIDRSGLCTAASQFTRKANGDACD